MKYAIITGASKGIGAATAGLFLKNNWQVINISRTSNSHEKITNFNFDLSSTNQNDYIELEKKMRPFLEQAECVAFIHNAGITTMDNINTIDLVTFQNLLQINLISAVILSNLFIKYMNAGSSIVLIGSTLSEKSLPSSCSYTTSKHGLVGLMRSLTQDVTAQGIHTCCVCPGPTDTELLYKIRTELGQSLEEMGQIQLVGKIITPLEIAEVVYFCATHPIINGEVIHANLGQRT
jgi:3-oxoacyl-[acyl-carrier protein] reductase